MPKREHAEAFHSTDTAVGCNDSMLTRVLFTYRVHCACCMLPGTKEQLKYRAKVAFMKKNCEAADPFTWNPKLPSDLIDTIKWSEKMDDTDVIRFWDETMKQIEGQATSFIENGAADTWFGNADAITKKV